MRKPFMPIVGAALLAGTLVIVGCVSVESTRAQLASSNPQVREQAKANIQQVVLDGHYGFQDFPIAERLEYVKLVSDDEFLFHIIGCSHDKEIIKAAAERIDLSKPGVRLEALSWHGKIDNSFKDIHGSGKPNAPAFSDKVLAMLSQDELEKAWYESRDDKELRKRIERRMIDGAKDVPSLFSLYDLFEQNRVDARKKEIILKLAGMPDKLPDSDAVLKVLKAPGYIDAKPYVEDAALRRGLIARLSDEEATKLILGRSEFAFCDLRAWDRDPRPFEGVLQDASAIKDSTCVVKIVSKVFEKVASFKRESGTWYTWTKKDTAKVEALRKRLPKLDDAALEGLICGDEAIWPYFIDLVSADVAYKVLSGGKATSDELEMALFKRLPKDRMDAGLYRGVRSDVAKKAVYDALSPEARKAISESKEKAFAAVCEKAKAAEKETFTLDGFYLGMSFDDMKVVFSHHFPKLEIKEGIDGEGKNADHVIYVPGQRSPFCYASVSDKKVYMFNFGKKLLKKWYPYDVQTPGEWARAYGREHKIDMKFRLIEKDATVYEPMDMSRSYRVWFHQESYQYRNNAKEYRLTYFGEEKDYTVHGGIGGALIKEMAAPRFRYVRGDYGSLRVNIERD